MPNIVLKVPAGAFDEEARTRLVEAITGAAADCERIPADPLKRATCWVLLEEIAPGSFGCGGVDMTAAIVPVMAIVYVPAGVLDGASRARYVDVVHRAVVDTLGDEPRRVFVSCIVHEVAEGTWVVNGSLWRLPRFAAAAGYEHLQHLAAEQEASR